MTCYVGFKAHDMGFDAHLTVCYFGVDNPDLDVIEKLVDQYQDKTAEYFVRRTNIDLFGPQCNIPVVRVEVPNLLHFFRSLFLPFSASQFVEWNPHITLDLSKPDTIHIPETIKLTDFGVY